MSVNLIADPWIPVVDHDGTHRIIAPWQMADEAILRVNWPRADLDIACLELLIGLVFLADPPADIEDWHDRQLPDPERLRDRLAAFAPDFNLMGDGPRFMQDLEKIESAVNSPDMLFIDNGSFLVTWGVRYPRPEPALIAMALYTLQAFAPAGGRGNRTSMRGGGPMVTLVQPEGGLWALIWANVPYGAPAPPEVLPWTRPAVTSEGGKQVFPEQAHPAEAFFGMPRRLRLTEEGDLITGVMQRPYGTNYAGWDHPLTPYYRQKLTEEWLPRHPRAGLFGYRNWLGVICAGQQEADGELTGLSRRAQTLRDWSGRGGRRKQVRVLVAGWSMDNMKPRDFTFSTQPFVSLSRECEATLQGMIEAAELFGLALRAALKPLLAEGESREAVREAFHARTQAAFETRLGELEAGIDPQQVAQGWVDDMRGMAMRLFEARAVPGLSERDIEKQREITTAHRNLGSTFAGYGAYGGKAFGALMLPLPSKKRKETA